MRKNQIYNPSATTELKARLRQEASAARRQAWKAAGASAPEAIKAQGLEAVGSIPPIQIASGYHPIRDELDPLPLLGALYLTGVKVALPVAKPGPRLVFRAWRPGSPLHRAKLGLQEPGENCAEIRPDLVLVPLLAFDRNGNRLGYGAGYYDSALRSLRQTGAVIAIGIGFDEQEFPDIPAEPQDEPLDMILTPSRVIACRNR